MGSKIARICPHRPNLVEIQAYRKREIVKVLRKKFNLLTYITVPNRTHLFLYYGDRHIERLYPP
jgi:hypothetical protein